MLELAYAIPGIVAANFSDQQEFRRRLGNAVSDLWFLDHVRNKIYAAKVRTDVTQALDGLRTSQTQEEADQAVWDVRRIDRYFKERLGYFLHRS